MVRTNRIYWVGGAAYSAIGVALVESPSAVAGHGFDWGLGGRNVPIDEYDARNGGHNTGECHHTGGGRAGDYIYNSETTFDIVF